MVASTRITSTVSRLTNKHQSQLILPSPADEPPTIAFASHRAKPRTQNLFDNHAHALRSTTHRTLYRFTPFSPLTLNERPTPSHRTPAHHGRRLLQ
ncbi:unnamed protein product [Parascedosporium putredinis]|uniref:Uncharacterized protein n=1 Tax=Parascedosporium putredinis TaxID=1442378 RepID=A0A9P1H8L8_9PEZI|nr:unnamed protein product [Parascedosporium putredinis]CAI8001014.1 unnamed protein product [Parascedosporium putredinis]